MSKNNRLTKAEKQKVFNLVAGRHRKRRYHTLVRCQRKAHG